MHAPLVESAIPWSFEVYHPRRGDDGVNLVSSHVRKVAEFGRLFGRPPEFCSVTTRVGSWIPSAEIAENAQRMPGQGLHAALHVCWGGESPDGRKAVMARVVASGLWGVLALRGDQRQSPVGGGEADLTGEDAAAGAASLSGPATVVLVAAHPGWWPRLSPKGREHTPADEAAWVVRKVRAAGDRAVRVVTQVCFDTARLVEFIRELRSLGCHAPVHAGVMVAKDASTLRRAAAMAGVEVEAGLEAQLCEKMDGARVAGLLAAELWHLAEASGVPLAGIHFFGMNETELLCESVKRMDDAWQGVRSQRYP